MRITNNMLTNNFMSDMNKNLQNMQTVQQQLTSGKLYQKSSDNPSAVTRSMQLNTSLDSIAQYNSNIQDTTNFLDTTDSALGQADSVIQRVRELMVSAGNAANTSSELSSIKDEINQNISQFSQILNTNFDGKYIFGGTRGNVKPVDAVNNSSIGDVVEISGSVVATASGMYTGSSDATIKVEVKTVVAGKATELNVSTSSDGGKTYGSTSIIDSKTNTFNLQNGVNFTISSGTSNATPPDSYTIDCKSNGNTKLVFCDDNGGELNTSSTATADQINQMSMLGADMKVEISQGVNINYNATAADLLKFSGTNSTGISTNYDLRTIFSNIVNHLDGKSDDGTVVDATATSKINGSDLTNIDTAMNNLLKMRSQVGAQTNRMTSALNQNTQQDESITDILSKTEDVDITKATMQYATLQNVYMASLSTSAKIIQPTLMDYLK